MFWKTTALETENQMILTKRAFKAGDADGDVGEIPDLNFNVFEGSTPSNLLASLTARGDVTIIGDTQVLDRLLWPEYEFPEFSHMVSACFARVDNSSPSLADTASLSFFDKMDLLIGGLNVQLGYGEKESLYLAGDMEAATVICCLARNKDHGWGQLPSRALIRIFPEEEFVASTVVILTTEIQNDQLVLRFFELPPEHAGLHYDDCRVLLTRMADDRDSAHE